MHHTTTTPTTHNVSSNPDHSAHRLGKHAPIHDPHLFALANYLTPSLPASSPKEDWSGKVSTWPMLANDRVGDCTCAAAAHLVHDWTSWTCKRSPTVLTDAQVLAAYSAITGYNLADPNSDNGANMADVLKFWRKTGIGGHKILAYVGLEHRNVEHVKVAVDILGGVYLGLALPLSAQTQRVWSVPATGLHGRGAVGSWGGHAVPVVAYDPHGLTVVTWGALKRMTWGFFAAYCDEAYGVLSPDWFDASNTAPSGFDLAALQADLAAL